jgi:riboflavin synthase
MKLGLVDCIGNKIDAFAMANDLAMARIAGVEMRRLTAPDILSTPSCAKRLFSQGCDSVIIFLTVDPRDHPALDLVHSKMVDVEIAAERFALFCLVGEKERGSQQELLELAQKRLEDVINVIIRTAFGTTVATSPQASSYAYSYGSAQAPAAPASTQGFFSTMSEAAGSGTL